MGTARNKLFINTVSTIEISSTIRASIASGFSKFFSKAISGGLNFSKRWMVLASCPVASDIRLAARPVGAASAIFFFRASKSAIRPLIAVVLPVPGPPVSTSKLCDNAFCNANF